MRSRRIYNVLILSAGLGLVSGTASAATFSFQGTFTTDDQIEIFSFVAGPGSVLLQTLSYSGGTNANSDSIAAGGFDPILSLFGPGPLGASTPLMTFDSAGFDSFIDTSAAPVFGLIPGQTYFVVLTEHDSIPNGTTYGDGFSEQGNGNFTGLIYGCASGQFCDINSDQRDGHWAVDITGVTAAQDLNAVPEPGSVWLLGCAGALALGIRRKFSAARQASYCR